MRAELQAYSKGKDLARLMAAALPLLQPHPTLLEGFATFVPKSARPQLQQRIAQMRGGAAGSNAVGRAAAAAVGGAPGGGMLGRQQPPLLQEPHQQQHRQQQPPQQQQQQQQQQRQQRPAAAGRSAMQAAFPQQPMGQQAPQQFAQPAGGMTSGVRQPLAQHPQLRSGQQAQQARQAQRPQQKQQKQQPKSKLQQMVAGAPLRPNPALGGAGAVPRPALPGTLQQQQQRGGVGAAISAAMLPPRGMQQAMAQPRPGQAGGMKAPPAVPTLHRPAAPAGGSRSKPAGGGSGGQPRAAGPPCAVCSKAPMESPHQSGCGHSACYGCWLKALATFKPCPVCAKPVRKAQLTKLHFV